MCALRTFRAHHSNDDPRYTRTASYVPRCAPVHHHHQQSFTRQAAILRGNVYFCECAVTTGGAPGPVYDLANSRACWLHDIIAVGIHTNNSSSRTTRSWTWIKDAGADAPALVRGRARGLEAYLWLLNTTPRAYHPHCQQKPVLSIPNSPRPSSIRMILQILRTRVTPSIIIIYLLFVIMIYYYFVPCGWMCLSLPPVWRQLPTSGSRTASPAGVHSADVRASCNYLYEISNRLTSGGV